MTAMPDPSLVQILEALLFAAPDPLSLETLKEASGAESAKAVRTALSQIEAACDAEKRPVLLQEVAGGFRLVTRPEYAPWVGRLAKGRPGRLTSAALETLAIIAYKQPVSRAEIEAVRGVAAGPILQTLLERDLIRVSGKSEALGHPLLYSTTKQFLEVFGLSALHDLPNVREFSTFAAVTDAPQAISPSKPVEPAPSGAS